MWGLGQSLWGHEDTCEDMPDWDLKGPFPQLPHTLPSPSRIALAMASMDFFGGGSFFVLMAPGEFLVVNEQPGVVERMAGPRSGSSATVAKAAGGGKKGGDGTTQEASKVRHHISKSHQYRDVVKVTMCVALEWVLTRSLRQQRKKAVGANRTGGTAAQKGGKGKKKGTVSSTFRLGHTCSQIDIGSDPHEYDRSRLGSDWRSGSILPEPVRSDNDPQEDSAGPPPESSELYTLGKKKGRPRFLVDREAGVSSPEDPPVAPEASRAGGLHRQGRGHLRQVREAGHQGRGGAEDVAGVRLRQQSSGRHASVSVPRVFVRSP